MHTWTTKAGKTLTLDQMTDNHLVNAIRHIRRNPAIPRSLRNCHSFDDLTDAYEAMVDYNDDIEEAMIAELARRGIAFNE